MNFDERLAAAAAKPRPHRDVPVILDEEAGAERDRLVAEHAVLVAALEAARTTDADDARLSAPTTAAPIEEALADLEDKIDAVQETARDAVVTLRFVRMPGDRWAAMTTRHPADPAVELHRYYGYDLDAVVLDAAGYRDPTTGEAYGFRLDGDDAVPMEPATWKQLFATLAGSDVEAIRDAVWTLNEYEPQQRVEAWVKGFGAATRSDAK